METNPRNGEVFEVLLELANSMKNHSKTDKIYLLKKQVQHHFHLKFGPQQKGWIHYKNRVSALLR